jgi:serine/threonine protein kinase
MVPVTPLTHLLGQPGPPPGCPGDLPTRIGRYAVLGVVGSGSFGTVYLAHDRDLNRPVAIKVPVAQQLGSENSIASVL